MTVRDRQEGYAKPEHLVRDLFRLALQVPGAYLRVCTLRRPKGGHMPIIENDPTYKCDHCSKKADKPQANGWILLKRCGLEFLVNQLGQVHERGLSPGVFCSVDCFAAHLQKEKPQA
jgi:hypothetical protein